MNAKLQRRLCLAGVAAAALLVALPAAAETGAIDEVRSPDGRLAARQHRDGGGPHALVHRVHRQQDRSHGTDGSVSEFTIPTAASRPDELGNGPDGNIWFAETLGNRIGRITPEGTITEFAVPTANSRPTAVAAGPDGNVWFTERSTGSIPGRVGRITPDGAITEYSLASTGHPLVITAGPDGAMWFTESPGNRIGRIEPATGAVIEFTVPTFQSAPWEITDGPDGNLWFTELNANKIARITPEGAISEFAVPTPGSGPNTIRRGPDPNAAKDCSFQRDTLGAEAFGSRYESFGGCVSKLATTKTLWFTEQNANRIAQITTDGTIFEFPLPTTDSQPGGIVEGPGRRSLVRRIRRQPDRTPRRARGRPSRAAGRCRGDRLRIRRR